MRPHAAFFDKLLCGSQAMVTDYHHILFSLRILALAIFAQVLED
jgi:hypothetical protein